jgi:hypothetical protein
MIRRLAILAVCLALPLLGGCYQRVVSSKGFGGMGTTVEEPYRSNTAADRAVDSMFGPPEKTFKGADNMPLRGKSQWTSDMTGGGVKGTLPKPGSAQGATGGN